MRKLFFKEDLNIFSYRYVDQSGHDGHVIENHEFFSGYNPVTPLSKPPIKGGNLLHGKQKWLWAAAFAS